MTDTGTIRTGRALALVVDDNEINRLAAAAVLCSCGVDAVLAESGAQAMRMCANSRYDLILMDYRMPEMNGVQAVRMIRGLGGWNAAVPVVGLSAETDIAALEGMDDYLSKPLQRASMQVLLDRWLPTGPDGAPMATAPPALQGDWLRVQEACSALDVGRALHQYGGDFTAYGNVLRVFCGSVPGSVETLERYARDNDWNNLRIAIHAQKGALKNIGAFACAGKAQRLEDLAGGGGYSELLARLPAMTGELQRILARLAGFWGDEAADGERPAATPAQRGAVRAQVEGILLLLERLEQDGALREMDALQAVRFGEKPDRLLREARQGIANFDYDGATVLLRRAADAVWEVDSHE